VDVEINVLLHIFTALKTFGHQITGIYKTTDVMFDNIKALKSN